MKIGLLDINGHNFPSLPLMKLSAWHKIRGDTVEPYDALKGYIQPYNKVYVSKVFDFTPDYEYPIYADEVVYGGTDYDLTSRLPPDVEGAYPDYSLYGVKNTAYGFLTRGCPRRCKFCIVAEKEGCKSRKVADLDSFWRGQKNIKLLDPNLLACREHELLLKQLAASGAWVDFTQGLDARLLNGDNINLIKQCKVKMIHFAWDGEKDSEIIKAKLMEFKKITKIDERKARVYVLTNFDTEFWFDLQRVYELKALGFDPYIMIFDKYRFVNKRTRKMYPIKTLLKSFTKKQIEHFKKAWALQRWVNNKIIFRSCERFEDYRPELG